MTLFLLEALTPGGKQYWLMDADGYTFDKRFALKFQTLESAKEYQGKSALRLRYEIVTHIFNEPDFELESRN
jgi:hypothetical protein